MNSALKWGLIAGGVYLLFRDQINFLLTGTTADATPATTTSTTPATPAATPEASASLATVKEKMRQAAATDVFFANGLGTWDHWNYYYSQFRGVDAPGPADGDHDRKISLDEFIAPITSQGLSGLSRSAARRAWGF